MSWDQYPELIGQSGYGGSSRYESSSYSSGGDAGFYGAGAGLGAAGYSGYESSYSSGAGYAGDAGYAGGYDSSAAYGVSGGYGGSYGAESASAYGISGGYEAGSAGVVSGGWATDAQGLYQDSNPQIIRRPAPGGGVTYKQNILVKFLQPPPVPPPGPLIIKEVRPPQPPPPPPLRIRQQAPPRPAPPPLVLRERPPVPPPVIQSQTVIRRLAALPVPPRSVIIERLPPLPPRQRDIIIERWIPYGRQAKRRVIVQRAAAARQYARPRNIIIQYEPIQARVVRQFQRLGVQAENPQSYVARYGVTLRDSHTLLQEARQAGVVEDISPPSLGFGVQSYGQEASFGSYGGVGGFGGADYASSYSSQSGYDSGYGGGYSGALYSDSGYNAGFGGGYAGGFEGGYDGGYSSSSYGSSVGGGYGVGFDAADIAFNAADVNHDGSIDQAEFRRFVSGGL
ncbi:unnamed protein product [Didymodactylos carnosus]|uniref:EF-hand domain-containing protein n=1 Tax=Didymodactylos carnosus TaxID=1234261 RepID=A0A8S2PAQ7_9BILA|nr:unnamed protein product [Didymodactylos carnosus]CAF4045535.1 unnamed protein product [Didymodactylos carnosus]